MSELAAKDARAAFDTSRSAGSALHSSRTFLVEPRPRASRMRRSSLATVAKVYGSFESSAKKCQEKKSSGRRLNRTKSRNFSRYEPAISGFDIPGPPTKAEASADWMARAILSYRA